MPKYKVHVAYKENGYETVLTLNEPTMQAAEAKAMNMGYMVARVVEVPRSKYRVWMIPVGIVCVLAFAVASVALISAGKRPTGSPLKSRTSSLTKSNSPRFFTRYNEIMDRTEATLILNFREDKSDHYGADLTMTFYTESPGNKPFQHLTFPTCTLKSEILGHAAIAWIADGERRTMDHSDWAGRASLPTHYWKKLSQAQSARFQLGIASYTLSHEDKAALAQYMEFFR